MALVSARGSAGRRVRGAVLRVREAVLGVPREAREARDAGDVVVGLPSAAGPARGVSAGSAGYARSAVPAALPALDGGAPGARGRTAWRGRTSGRVRFALGGVGVVLAGAALSASAGPAGAVGLPRPGLVAVGDRLTVTYDDGTGAPVTRTLTCGEGAAFSEREVRAACGRLEELGGPLAPVPAGQMCAMVYGGPQTAHVTGRWHGLPVDETYRRTNGCEVARWKRMEPALPVPTGGEANPLAS